MKRKQKLVDVVIAVVIIIFGVPTVLFGYYTFMNYKQENKLKKTLNNINIESDYKKVYSVCGDVTFVRKCTNGYYAPGDIGQIESTTITNLKERGYNFEKMQSGPSPAYRAWSGEVEIVIQFDYSDNQEYKENMGNIKVTVF